MVPLDTLGSPVERKFKFFGFDALGFVLTESPGCFKRLKEVFDNFLLEKP